MTTQISQAEMREALNEERLETMALKWMRYSGLLLDPLAWGHVLIQDILVSIHAIDLDYLALRWTSLDRWIYDFLLLTFTFAHGDSGLCQVMKSLSLLRGSLRCNLRAGSLPGLDAVVMRASMSARCAGRWCSDVWMDEAVMLGLGPPNPQVLPRVRLKSQLVQDSQEPELARVPQLVRQFRVLLPQPISRKSQLFQV